MADFKFIYPVVSWVVIDGDTALLERDKGEHNYDHRYCRLCGVDTPETRHYRANPCGALEKQAGLLVKGVVEDWLAGIPAGELMVASVALDKYARRFIGRLARFGDMENDLSSFLLANGFALPYDGGKKAKWTKAKLTDIVKRLG